MNKKAISVSHLVKTFGTTKALDGLDLGVSTGEIYGILGPNGAGKTTLLRILLGLIRQDSGEASVLDSDPWRDVTVLHRRLAYVPGDVALWPDLSGGEVIDLLGRLRGGVDPRRRAYFIEKFELDPSKKCGTYSTGNRQKTALVAALSSNVELLILDEPTLGLDPLMEVVFRQSIIEEKKNGRTVLLSSHILSEVEALCDRLTIIRRGRAVESGTLAELRLLTRTSVAAEVSNLPAGLDKIPGVFNVRIEGNMVRCETDDTGLNELMRYLTSLGLRSLVSQPPTLEDLFLHYYNSGHEPLTVPAGDKS